MDATTTKPDLEQRIEALEMEVAELKAAALSSKGAGGAGASADNAAWRKTIGWAESDPEFSEMMELGRRWREKANKRQTPDARPRHQSRR